MSGAKRRTPYRKKVTESVLYQVPELTAAQKVAMVVKPHGTNLLELQSESGDVGIAMLPTKFRKLVWIKRGDFVLVSEAEGDYDTATGKTGKVRFMIDTVLYPDQIKHLKDMGKWPERFEKEAIQSIEEEESAKSKPAGISAAPLKPKLQGKGGFGGGAARLMQELSSEEEDGDGDDAEEDSSSDEDDRDAAALWVERSRMQRRDLPPSVSDDEDEAADEDDNAGVAESKLAT